MLGGGVQFETGGTGPVQYLNILEGTSKKKNPVESEIQHCIFGLEPVPLLNHSAQIALIGNQSVKQCDL